jgi:hypothetical protein
LERDASFFLAQVLHINGVWSALLESIGANDIVLNPLLSNNSYGSKCSHVQHQSWEVSQF